MWEPSTSASVMTTMRWYRSPEASNALPWVMQADKKRTTCFYFYCLVKEAVRKKGSGQETTKVLGLCCPRQAGARNTANKA